MPKKKASKPPNCHVPKYLSGQLLTQASGLKLKLKKKTPSLGDALKSLHFEIKGDPAKARLMPFFVFNGTEIVKSPHHK